jgi:hypothetical protein
MIIALLVGLGLTIANFAYQGCAAQNWILAVDRSFFQVTACLVMASVDYSIRWRLGVA